MPFAQRAQEADDVFLLFEGVDCSGDDAEGARRGEGEVTRERAQKAVEAVDGLSPQSSINGLANAWIVKPAGKSRGRGIQVARPSFSPLLRRFRAPGNPGLFIVGCEPLCFCACCRVSRD